MAKADIGLFAGLLGSKTETRGIHSYKDVPLNGVSFPGFQFQDRVSFMYGRLNDRVNIFITDSVMALQAISLREYDLNRLN